MNIIKAHEPSTQDHVKIESIEETKVNEVKEEVKEEKEEKGIEEEIEEPLKVNFTHFICVPLTNLNPFNKKLKIFQEKVKDIDPDLEHFFYTKTPHFTLLMLSLEPD